MSDPVKHTPGPWYGPHLAEDDCSCNCRSIVSDYHAGAICTIDVNNGLAISDGGNDAPPLEEAKANGRLIAAAPDLLKACQALIDAGDTFDGIQLAFELAEKAIDKAEGRLPSPPSEVKP